MSPTPLAFLLLLLLLQLLVPVRSANSPINTADKGLIDEFYNSLTNKGNLTQVGDWCTLTSLFTCKQNNGKVTQINFSNLGLVGTIPTSFGGLTAMTSLDLSLNQLSGTIPTQLASLTALQDLDLHSNQFTGTIPSTLAAIATLKNFLLQINQLSGTIPSFPSINLKKLNLQSNLLTGSFPSISSAILTKIMLQENQLTGTIPTTISSWTALQDLRLGTNNFTGTIPTQLSNMVTLQSIVLNNNQLTGSIPSLSALTSLDTLNLNTNQLTGSIPSLSTLTSLKTLNLNTNQLTGTIPPLNNLVALTSLNLNTNQLNGTIPPLNNLVALTSLALGYNQLTGTIPSFSTSLTTISLSSNQLTGTIPPLNNLVNLTSLALDNNQLSGTVTSMSLPLMYLYLNGNQFTGTIPSFVSQLTTLLNLDLSSNQFTGSIPSSLNQLTLLQGLYLSNNQLTGTVPTLSIVPLNFLYLQGSGNNFCPIVDYSLWALNSTDFVSSSTCAACTASTCQNSGSCSGGDNQLFTCTCASTWVGTNCETLACPSITFDHADFPKVAAGSSTPGSCAAGYSGSPSRACKIDGTWDVVVNPCQQIMCPSQDTQHATFPETAAGSSASGTCEAGYSGSPSRSCKLDGTWDTVSGSCQQLFCSDEIADGASFPSTAAGSSATVSCPAGSSGSITRPCKIDGTWDVASPSCTQLSCPDDTVSLAHFDSTAAGSSASGTCPAGYSGSPSRSCKLDGTWDAVVGSCQQLFCPAEAIDHADFSQTAAGSNATSSCPAGFTGSPTRFCQLDGTWDVVAHPCQQITCPEVTVDHAKFTSTVAGSSASGACDAGYSGSPSRACKIDGTWDAVVGSCQQLFCSAETIGDLVFTATASDSYATVPCPAGASGSATRHCKLDGTWDTVVEFCDQLYCAHESIGNAGFPPTAAGSSASGTCEAGYSGSPSRACKIDGTWDVVVNPCQQIMCPSQDTQHATFPETAAGSSASGTCEAGYSGSPSRSCMIDGTWDVVVGSCQQLFCPAETIDHADFSQTAAGSSATASCPSGSSGSPSRACKIDGTWDAVVGSCQQSFCPAETVGHADFPQTAAGSSATASCPAGFSGSPSRACKLDGTWDVVAHPCQQITCPAQTAQHSTFPDTPAGTTASGTCITGYSGSPSRACKIDGTWDDLTGEICAPTSPTPTSPPTSPPTPPPTSAPTPPPTSAPTSTPTPSSQHGESNLSTEAVIGIAVGSVAGFLLIVGLGGLIYFHLFRGSPRRIHDSGLELKGGSMGEMSEYGVKL